MFKKIAYLVLFTFLIGLTSDPIARENTRNRTQAAKKSRQEKRKYRNLKELLENINKTHRKMCIETKKCVKKVCLGKKPDLFAILSEGNVVLECCSLIKEKAKWNKVRIEASKSVASMLGGGFLASLAIEAALGSFVGKKQEVLWDKYNCSKLYRDQ